MIPSWQALKNASRLLITCFATLARRCPLANKGWSCVERTFTKANSAATKNPFNKTKKMSTIRLGDEAPNFTAQSTEGEINFYNWLYSIIPYHIFWEHFHYNFHDN